jgi:hypothetical protein
MPSPNRNYVSTAQPTTLAASLGASGNPEVESMPGEWSSEYPYTVLLDWGQSAFEAVSVTGPATGGGPFTLPCDRGIDGTTAQAHQAGAQAVPGVTAQDFAEPQAHIAATADVHGITGSLNGFMIGMAVAL